MLHTTFIYMVVFLICIGMLTDISQSQEITDIPFGTIQGQVTDNQNNPLSDYIISAISQTDTVTYADKTNSGGQFLLTNLTAGTWNVQVRYHSTILTQRDIRVAQKTTVNADFVIEGKASISGFLMDSADKHPIPITGVIKVALLTGGDQLIERTYNGTVSQGYFKVEDLLPGRYRIIDAFDGYVFSLPNTPILKVHPNRQLTGVNVFLKPGATLHGRVVDVQNGQPISKVIVSTAAEKSNTVYPDRQFLHETETDTNGEFRLTTPNDSDIYYAYTIITSHPRYQTHRWQSELSPNKNVYELGELTLNPYLSLQGTVSSSKSGASVVGLTIQLKMHNRSADFFRAAAQPDHTVNTDMNGKFIFSELHPITYSLTIYRNDVIIAFQESVNPQSDKPLKFSLPKLKTLQGTVVDTKQHPIQDVQLYAARRTENRHGHDYLLSRTQTDTNGNFNMQLFNTKPQLLSLKVSKKGYLSRVYPNLTIEKDPLTITLHAGLSIKGRVVLPKNIPSNGLYEVKLFPKNANMQSALNPLTLSKPIISKRFPVTDHAFVMEGLIEEQYILYITGDSIAATAINVQVSLNAEEVFIVSDKPTVELKGQLFWVDTGKPVQNALVSRSWYPWELSRYDMSLTLDRFETETDKHGKFSFSNLTQERYELHIRAVQSVFNKKSGTHQRVHIQKQITIPFCTEDTHRIYLGKADGTHFTKL